MDGAALNSREPRRALRAAAWLVASVAAGIATATFAPALAQEAATDDIVTPAAPAPDAAPTPVDAGAHSPAADISPTTEDSAAPADDPAVTPDADSPAPAAVEADAPAPVADAPSTAADSGPPVPVSPAPEGAASSEDNPCREPEPTAKRALVDKMQSGVFRSVCGTARWFDGLFGTRRFDQDSDETFGRLGLYEIWDERDGFDTRVRMRVRLALPTMERRMRLFFGRADEREVIEDSQPGAGGSVPSSFQRVEDESWLLGLGYSKQGKLENGFDFGAGIRIRTPVDPFTKGSYRHNFVFSDDTALRARQTVFWRDSRGFGETTEIDVDHLLTPNVLIRWDNSATLAEDVRRLEFSSALITFQSLGNRRAISYTAFISGIANTDVPVRNYGAEVRFRRQFMREWLFLEARTSVTWPRDTLAEEREINPGLGLGFEMYFGPVPDEQLR